MASSEKIDFSQFDRQSLLTALMEMQEELRKKKMSLKDARGRLIYARKKIRTLKETIDFQRKRIVELYKDQSKVQA